MKKLLLGVGILFLLASCGSSSSGDPAKISSEFECSGSGEAWAVSYTVKIEAPSNGCKSLPYEVAFYALRNVTSCSAYPAQTCESGTPVKVHSIFDDAGHLSFGDLAEFSGTFLFGEKIVDVKAFID